MGDSEPDGWPARLIAAGLLVGLALGVVAAWALRPSTEAASELPPLIGAPPPTLGPESPASADAFLEAWERSRRATYLTITEWYRVTDAGAELSLTRVLAQRPPDRVRLAGRAVSGTAGGVRHTCDELEDDGVECRAFVQGETADYDARVDREVELMREHVEGTNPLYRVSHDGDCYLLRLGRAMLVPPYGHRTTFCFDADSGAVSRFRIERREGTDEERLIWVTTEVTDDDVRAVATGRFDPAEATSR